MTMGRDMMTKSMRSITAVIGVFMLFPGTVKFVDPFKTMFTTQIERSELPFPVFTYWSGQLGEISVGLLLLGLLLLGKRLPTSLVDRLFLTGNLAVAFIMGVAIYVHLHPNVPAEVLPLEEKFPLLSLFVLALVGLNLFLWRQNSHENISDNRCSIGCGVEVSK